jgi:glutathione S-transferase
MGRAKVRNAHANLERLLKGSRWLAGDRRTAADAYFMGLARWNDFHRVLDRRDYPGVHDLHERLASDPAVRFAHAVEHEEAVRGAGGFAGHVELKALLAAMPASR